MPKNTDRHKKRCISYRCSEETDQRLSDLAQRKQCSKVEIVRELVEAGLIATNADGDKSHLNAVVRDMLADVLSPCVERLAAIGAKAAQISSAAFFMSVWTATREAGDAERAEIREAAAQARQLGVRYLRLSRDGDLDAFLRECVGQMLDGEEQAQ